jgi:CTP:molybdopterin cytidylyltransferase MocA
VNSSGFETAIMTDPRLGMGQSLSQAVDRLDRKCQAIYVSLGDMPFVKKSINSSSANAMKQPKDIWHPKYRTLPGHSVIFGSDYLCVLGEISGETGAGLVI